VTYRNPDNDFQVVKVEPEGPIAAPHRDRRGEVVLVGQLPGIEVGQSIEAEGQWSVHPRHGPQFQADWVKPRLPTGRRGMEAYLASGAIKGIGPVLARRIVEAFGERTFEVLDAEIDRLRGVRGITPRRLDQVRRAWWEARVDRSLIAFLGEHGIPVTWAGRLRRAYGENALAIVASNPYRLAAEVRGMGFARADAIARRLGLPAEAPDRIDAAIRHVLETAAEDGHTFLPRDRLLAEATRWVSLDPALVEGRLQPLIEEGRLFQEPFDGGTAVFLVAWREVEVDCARQLDRLIRARRPPLRLDLPQFFEAFERRARIRLAPAQRAAVEIVARDGLLVLTGGPGTGKTTTLRAVIEIFAAARRSLRLAAPTGRAARRLTEATKAPAETIHRLLGYQPVTGRFAFGPGRPIEGDLIIVDECSMLDVALARDLLAAVRDDAALLLVGDEDQLPSVGPGNVLADVIASGRLRVLRLQEVFRQAEASLIVLNAHRINQGKFPLLASPAGSEASDFFFIERQDPPSILETIKMLVADRIPRRFGLDPIADIQVLTPMRRGDLGVAGLNRLLQNLLNPRREGPAALLSGEDDGGGPMSLRVGDRVMQTVNEYEKDVANGEIGRVEAVRPEAGEILVRFEGRLVSYLADEARQLQLAYAVTIHKSQGSEYPAVVIPVHGQHHVMLQRNLIYTALTRARRLACIVGSRRALWRAIRNRRPAERFSALGRYLAALGQGRGLD